jgi:hypothetical protein
MLHDHFRSGSMRKLERGMLGLRIFLSGNDHRQGKAGSEKYGGSGIFSDKGCCLELI